MFEEIEEKLLETMNVDGLTVEELNKFFDKKMKLAKRNKMGEELFLYRHISSDKVMPGYFNNKANYFIINAKGGLCGKISSSTTNVLAGDEVEIEYYQAEQYRNRGNISIALNEVIADIFLNKPLNGFPIRPNVVSDIKKIFLAIKEDNFPSQRIAEKTGFKKKNDTTYELTLSEYLDKIRHNQDEPEPGE